MRGTTAVPGTHSPGAEPDPAGSGEPLDQSLDADQITVGVHREFPIAEYARVLDLRAGVGHLGGGALVHGRLDGQRRQVYVGRGAGHHADLPVGAGPANRQGHRERRASQVDVLGVGERGHRRGSGRRFGHPVAVGVAGEGQRPTAVQRIGLHGHPPDDTVRIDEHRVGGAVDPGPDEVPGRPQPLPGRGHSDGLQESAVGGSPGEQDSGGRGSGHPPTVARPGAAHRTSLPAVPPDLA